MQIYHSSSIYCFCRREDCTNCSALSQQDGLRAEGKTLHFTVLVDLSLSTAGMFRQFQGLVYIFARFNSLNSHHQKGAKAYEYLIQEIQPRHQQIWALGGGSAPRVKSDLIYRHFYVPTMWRDLEPYRKSKNPFFFFFKNIYSSRFCLSHSVAKSKDLAELAIWKHSAAVVHRNLSSQYQFDSYGMQFLHQKLYFKILSLVIAAEWCAISAYSENITANKPK